ncbi:hypothetical protein UCRPC4_g05494 [Phaeomoniella chlamydospora]|uniref:Uncharacterized protein n=1 Tax=Phaeomoniella chlamydospora TaxID=158046 RepID=A0A0G2E5B6_PHACM|nr:hypothetical protein UCRPC4_g05494 [Phaeomoniella chlamydospora]
MLYVAIQTNSVPCASDVHKVWDHTFKELASGKTNPLRRLIIDLYRGFDCQNLIKDACEMEATFGIFGDRQVTQFDPESYHINNIDIENYPSQFLRDLLSELLSDPRASAAVVKDLWDAGIYAHTVGGRAEMVESIKEKVRPHGTIRGDIVKIGRLEVHTCWYHEHD